MKKQQNVNLRAMTMTAMLSAMAAALMYLNFSIPIMPGFIKLDFSELPALIASFAINPLSGAVVCLIKNIAKLFSSPTGGVGELSNFILGVAFVVPAGMIYRKHKTRKGAFVGSLVGAALMAAVGLFSNYYLVYPIYSNFMPIDTILSMYQAILPRINIDSLWKALLIFNVPFTFFKGMCSVVITFLIYKKISPLIKGKRL